MTYILGVDPGKISGWCLYSDARPIVWGQTGAARKPMTGADVADILEYKVKPLREQHYKDGLDVTGLTLAIEGQFIPTEADRWGRYRAQAVSALKTARYAGIWIGVCEAHGVASYEHRPGDPTIPPGVWRAAVWGGAWRSEQAKTHAVEMARIVWGVDLPKSHHHVAEAIWIAAYAWKEVNHGNPE